MAILVYRSTPYKLSLTFVLFASFFYSNLASAVDYYWSGINGSGLQFTAPTPYQLCNEIQHNSGYSEAGVTTPPLVAILTATTADCTVYYRMYFTQPGDPDIGFEIDLVRLGDSCPIDTVYNPSNGSCEQDCSTTIGQKLAARGPDSSVTTDGDGYKTLLPEPFGGSCFTGCYYELQSSFSDRLSCMLVSGSTDTGFCNYRVTGNGETCANSDGVPAGSGDPLNPDPEPDPEDPGCPEGYAWTGNFCAEVPDGGGDGDGSGDGDGDGDGPGDGSGDGDGSGGGSGGDGSGVGGGNGGGTGDGDGSGDGDGDGSSGGGGSGDGDGDC
ncbi:hypothetical protein LCGC14_2146540, partial [marine sediment metagenome]